MFGTAELIIILCVVLVLFGGKKLPELAKSLGIGIREFKKAVHGMDEPSEHVKTSNQTEKEIEPTVIVIDPKRKDQ